MMIYHTKLKNLITAHQSVYAKLLHDNPNDLQKNHLRKLLSQIQRNIQKLIRDKNYEILQNNNKKKLEKEIRQRRKKSTTTTTKKKKSSSPSNRVIKSRNSIRYFIRRDRIDKNDRLDHRLLSSAIVDHSILINHDDEQKFCRISNEKTTTTNDNNKQDNESRIKESNKNDQDSDHSSSVDLDQNHNDNNNDDAKHHHPCNGHGKTIDAKEDFLRMLDLVHKIDLEKMANCKKPRKRRTTANPQFSHAAIEAKRITQMEIANERRHRRRLALETKQQRRHSKQQINNNKNLSSSSSSSSKQPNDYIKSINIFKPANEMFPGLFNIMTDPNMEHHDNRCKLCSELCNYIDDTIVLCQQCLSMFHVNCLERKYFIHMNGHDDSNRIRCCICPSSSSSSSITFDNDELFNAENLMIKLAQIRKEILLSSNANYCLQQFLKKKQCKKEKLLADLDRLHRINDRIVNISTRLNSIDSGVHQKIDNNDDQIDCIHQNEGDYHQQPKSNVRISKLSNYDSIDSIDRIDIHSHPKQSQEANNTTTTTNNNNVRVDQEYSILSFCA
ncbi:uncharacterized protein LOC113792165 [Dermatophagoides pteronyssinus]|uniref:uncharacterized protein LOC113792165 n=1 Tax=Dermatophagoides pteronyssinus TaxID=6956 RepID=UPI003F6766B1